MTAPAAEAAPASPEPLACRNCAHAIAIADVYCPHCGQETRTALPTAREFLREAAGRYVALDGRLLRTLRGLARPGFLTLEYFAGRRRRYIRPGRLFLVTSLLAFATVRIVASSPINVIVNFDAPEKLAGPADVRGAGDRNAGGAKAPRAPQESPRAPDGGAAAAAARADDDPQTQKEGGPIISTDDFNLTVDPDLNLQVLRDRNGRLPGALRERIDHFNQLPRDAKVDQIVSNVFRYGPYAAIVLLPAFALLLAGVYPLPSRRYPQRPRRFAAHLVFAAHNHAFLFVLTTIVVLLPGRGPLVPIALLAAPVYLVWSLRRVYGGGWLSTLARSALLLMLYAVLFFIVTLALLFMALLLK